MPVFEYIALNSGGRQVKGTIDADSERAARQKLRGQSIYPTDIHEGTKATEKKARDVSKYFQSNRISAKDLGISTRQLATLIGAGLPLVTALTALSEQTESQVLQRIIVTVKESVEEGSSLAKALAEFPKSFPRLYINMVAAGEASGNLDTVLSNLADYLEAQLELRRRVTSALVYPILMLCICTLVVVGLVTVVVPRIVEIFKKQGASLPLPTQIMIFISDTLVNYWYLFIILIFGGGYLVGWYYRQPEGRFNIDKILLKLPIFGKIYTKVTTARFAKTLGTLVQNGVDLLLALEITRNIMGNVHFVRAIEDTREGVREGKSLATELAKTGVFPVLLSHMVAVGEKSGELESMLGKVGKAYENEVNATLAGLTSLLEPLMMIVVGIIVLCIIFSVLLPMTSLMDVLGK